MPRDVAEIWKAKAENLSAECEARVAEITAQLAEARESERAAVEELNAHKDAMASQGPTFEREYDDDRHD